MQFSTCVAVGFGYKIMTINKKDSGREEAIKEARLKASPIIIIGFLICAIMMFSAGIPRYLKTKEFVDNSVSTIGVISDIEKGTQKTRGGRTKVAYYVIYTFRAENGEDIKGKSSVPRGPYDFKVNDPITILYNPCNPSDSKMKTFSDLWMHVFFFNLLGFIFVIGSIFVLKIYKRYLKDRSHR